MSALKKLLDGYKAQKAIDDEAARKAAADAETRQLQADQAYLERAQAALRAALPDGLFDEIVVGGEVLKESFRGSEFYPRCARLTTTTPIIFYYRELAGNKPVMELHYAGCKQPLPTEAQEVAKFIAGAIGAEREEAEEREKRAAEQARLAALQEAVWPASIILGAYKITYTQTATDDDGQRYVEKKHLYSLDDLADYDGFWTVFKGGTKRQMKILATTLVERVDFSRGDYAGVHFAVPFRVGDDEVQRPVDELLWGQDPALFPGLPTALFERPSEIPF